MCSLCGFTRCPDGCPNHPESVLQCPVCGRECEDLYISIFTGDTVGCDRCIQVREVLDTVIGSEGG